MGVEEVETEVKTAPPAIQYDSNGDQKSISADDALLLSMGKEPELRRSVKFGPSCLFEYADMF